eukprot:scaffold285_cov330-Pavlova_lutheri.AAC.61
MSRYCSPLGVVSRGSLSRLATQALSQSTGMSSSSSSIASARAGFHSSSTATAAPGRASHCNDCLLDVRIACDASFSSRMCLSCSPAALFATIDLRTGLLPLSKLVDVFDHGLVSHLSVPWPLGSLFRRPGRFLCVSAPLSCPSSSLFAHLELANGRRRRHRRRRNG